MLLSDVMPWLATELKTLLLRVSETELAQQVASLTIVDRCDCGSETCAMFYTAPKPCGAYGPGLRNVALSSLSGWLTLDVVDDQIKAVEALDREDVKEGLEKALPPRLLRCKE
jgi:hypothetical protein